MGSSCFPINKNQENIILPSTPSGNAESRSVRLCTEELDPSEKMYRDNWTRVRSHQKLNRIVLNNFEKVLRRNINGLSKYSKFTTKSGKSRLNNTIKDNSSDLGNDSSNGEIYIDIKKADQVILDKMVNFKNSAKPQTEVKIGGTRKSNMALTDKKLTIMSEIDEKLEESMKNSSNKSGIGSQFNPYNTNSNLSRSKESRHTKLKDLISKDYTTLKQISRKLSDSPNNKKKNSLISRSKFRSKSVNPKKEDPSNMNTMEIKMHFKTGKEILIN